jgi:hypothetical protein
MVHRYSRPTQIHFNLVVDPSDLLGLLLQLCSKLFNLLLLFLNLSMFFEELVQQHCVYRFVADGIGLFVGVAHHQIRLHLFDFLSNETKLGYPVRVEV